MDAMDYRWQSPIFQYTEEGFSRELGKVTELLTPKAYIAFLEVEKSRRGVATGNWGCGAFGGDLQHKFFLQWMAATLAGQPKVFYYTFADKNSVGVRPATKTRSRQR